MVLSAGVRRFNWLMVIVMTMMLIPTDTLWYADTDGDLRRPADSMASVPNLQGM